MVQTTLAHQSPLGATEAQPHWWNEQQVTMMPPSLTKATDDGSESTHSGSPSEPPMSPEPPKLTLTTPSKLPDVSPNCSTLGSKSTNISPMGLTVDTESLASPISASGMASMRLDSIGATQLRASFDQVALAAPQEPPSICSTPSALPPPPSYHAPSVSAPGLPPAPALPPGVPEPPKAPPRLPANVPASSCELNPPWPKAVPPATLPWQMGPHIQASTPLSFGHSTTVSSTMPSGLVTTPMCTSTGSLAHSMGLSPNGMQLPPRALSGATSLPMHSVDAMAAGLLAASCGSGDSLDDDVAAVSRLCAMLASGPPVPPLPPSGCYGSIFISSAISESLGAAADTVAAAARDLGDKPVKVLLPWYPAHAGLAIYDHTKPAKVAISSS